MIKTWESPTGTQFSSLAVGQTGAIVEVYSERRNGFDAGEEVEAVFPGKGKAVLRILTDTQTCTRSAINENGPGCSGRKMDLSAFPPDAEFFAFVRYEVLQVLTGESPQREPPPSV